MTQELPPPSLNIILSTFATQAAVALGQMENPVTKKREVDLAHAKFAIDLLKVLEEKTEGHRTTEETQFLEDVLYRLRLVYVDKSSKK